MNKTLASLIATSCLALGAPGHAAVTAEEAKALGTTLTEMGAIKAGNKEGTIPAYTGGLTKAPADFKPGSGYWADPYAAEKPLYRIDAKNMAQYADKLAESQKYLLKTYATYYIDVYPTHRSVAYPESVNKATVRNATTCNASKDYAAVDLACRGGVPFAIPKNGYEVMWNLALRYSVATDLTYDNGISYLVDSKGSAVIVSDQFTRTERPYFQTEQKDRDPNLILRTYSVAKAPARISGQMTMLTDYIDMDAKPRRAYNYSPGQRRVKLAPEFAYDTPVAQLGGVTLFDELFLFSGKMDRFDFKLVGRKEMLIPYNSYKFYECKGPNTFVSTHMNPECERTELHRVWVVESTLKPGQRHAYAKRTYYLDEDGTGAGMFDAFDKNGELYRGMFQGTIQLYDNLTPYSGKTITYDFSKRMMLLIGEGKAFVSAKNLPEVDLSPEAVVSRETVR